MGSTCSLIHYTHWADANLVYFVCGDNASPVVLAFISRRWVWGSPACGRPLLRKPIRTVLTRRKAPSLVLHAACICAAAPSPPSCSAVTAPPPGAAPSPRCWIGKRHTAVRESGSTQRAPSIYVINFVVLMSER